MRITFYAPMKPPDSPVPSGDRTMARLLVAALRRCGHEVVPAARLRSRDGVGDPARQRRLEALGRRLAERFVRRTRATPPDLWFTYHLYHKAPDWIGPEVCDALSIPYVVAEASYAPKRAGGPWAPGHEAVAAAIGRADAVIALNDNDVACIRPLLAAPDRLHRLLPFIDTQPYEAAAADHAAHRAALAARYDVPDEAILLLAVGMMRDGDKLASYRALAAALTRQAQAGWRLLIVGDGPARGEVEAAFAPHRAAGRVAFAGALERDALAAAYAGADLLVWPSVNEAYGVSLIEAQAAGLPVLAAATGGIPSIVRDGETGRLVPPGDVAAFADALSALMADPGGRARMGARAREVAAAEHDIRTAAVRLEEILTRAASRVAA